MNRDAALYLINQSFDRPFDDEEFERLVTNLLNQVHRDRSFGLRSGNIIPQAFRSHISTYRRPFVYYDPDGERLDVLIVRLARGSSLERARTMQRNFIAWYLKQDHNEPVEAALVAFHHEDVPDWRFSLVRLEYAFGEEGVEESLTPARRYSFLVGPHEPTHTAAQQLLPFLLDDAQNPTIDRLAQAFQIEVVSKQFFDAYRELFLTLLEHLQRAVAQDEAAAADFQQAGIDLPNFAKKLLGQIVFLYFIQKKGWLGVPPGREWGSGPKDYLRRLFEREDGISYASYFNEVLEPLFYDALASERRDDLFHLDGHRARIPFLNGGLFEPMGGYDWRTTLLALPNELFSNRRDERDDRGTGILDVFDRYNFTVWEEEPLDKEVAVDPEMLGKVFENLLEVQDRKSKGAFYTPREIVHFMCQESLIHYLDTAINMAAVPVGEDPPVQDVLFGDPPPRQQALTNWQRRERVPREQIARLVRLSSLALQQDAAKQAGLQKGDWVLDEGVRQRKNAQALDDALAAIKLCDPAIGSGAFPVGMLHEIVQARRALAIYRIDDPAQRPAPYDLKRHAIQQSIYGVDVDASAVEIAKLRLWLSLVVDEESYDAIQPLPNLGYKIVCGNSLQRVEQTLFNNDAFARLEERKQEYFAATLPGRKAAVQTEIERLIDQISAGSDQFDFHVYFSEVFQHRGGFDVVIGNPPYVRQELIRDQKPTLKQNFPNVYAGTADLYVYFYAQGMKILRERGVLAFISSNKFMRAAYGKRLRGLLGGKVQLHTVIDFGDAPVFDATAYPVIVVASKEPPANSQVDALAWETSAPIADFVSIFHSEQFPVAQTTLTSDGWQLVAPAVQNLMAKLAQVGTPLGEFIGGRFYRGILTGYNTAFIVNRRTHDRLIQEDASSAKLLKPFLRGRNVNRWLIDFDDHYLIKIESSANIQHPWSGRSQVEAEHIFANTYPAVYRHFQQYRQKLIDRHDQGRYYWELRACSYWQEFEQPKIAYPDIADRPEFSFDEKMHYLANTLYLIPTSRKWLLGILNSNLIWWFYSNISSTVRGGYLRFIAQYVSQIPIATGPQQAAIERLVQQVLSRKKADPAADVTGLEREIDGLVYGLYGLTAAEVRLIEETVGGSAQ